MLLGSLLSALAAAQSEKATHTSDVICEAATLHYEASTEPYKGKRAVLDTIRNRATTLGKSSCQILMQKGQFAFVHKKFKWRATKDMLDIWHKVDMMGPVVPEAYYFNSGKRKRGYKFIKRIGAHNFYLRE